MRERVAPGSRQPAGSISTWGTSGCSPSHCQSGLEVGRAPTRSTTSGGWLCSHPAAASGSAVAMSRLRSWLPARAPERGSATIGRPRAAAQAAAAAGSAGSSCGPSTSKPRRPDARAATRATASGVGSIRPGSTVGGGAEGPGGGPVGTRGSRKRRLRCTGPGGDSRALPTRRAARAAARPGAPSPGSGGSRSRDHLTAVPKRPAWSMVCGAPTPCRSAGRSAVIKMSGTRPCRASTAAGRNSAAAVPEVQTATAGNRVARAMPRAKKAEERSSWWGQSVMPGSSARARASGVLRDPGVTQACATPSEARARMRGTVNP